MKYLFQVSAKANSKSNNRSTRKRYEICSKKKLKQHKDVIDVIVYC